MWSVSQMSMEIPILPVQIFSFVVMRIAYIYLRQTRRVYAS